MAESSKQTVNGEFKFGTMENGVRAAPTVPAINPIFSSLYVLVEWSPAGKKCYDIVPALDIMNSSNLNSGSMIFVRSQQRVIPANIIVISDDRSFLTDELNKINSRSQENLSKMHSITIQSTTEEPAHKRSRSVSSDVCNIESNSNSNSAWQHFDQHTMQPPTQILMTNDRIITPRSQVANKPTVIVAPPMTFDQQTQTEGKNDTSLYLNHEVLSGQKSILAEQRMLRAELTTIAEKLDKFISGFEFSTDVQTLNNGNTTTPRDIVVSSVSGADSSYTVINTSNQSEKPSENIMHEDYNTSRFSFNDTNFSTTSSDPDAAATSSGAFKSGSSKNVSNSSRRSSTISLNIHSPTLHEMVRDNWNGAVNSQTAANFTICDAPQPPPAFKVSPVASESRTVSLGSNHTQISAEILNSIDWSNYKAATRKLLVSLFDRNILANHSLTGKPSPAFVGRGKPMKNRLDPEKISDIIEAVIKYTGVQENLIRTAITTKCADENKMARQRFQRNKVLQENSSENLKETPTQCTNILTYIIPDQPPKIINGSISLPDGGETRVKLDNKENIIVQKN